MDDVDDFPEPALVGDFPEPDTPKPATTMDDLLVDARLALATPEPATMVDPCAEDFPEPVRVDDVRATTVGDLHVDDCLGAATPNPGTPERWCFPGDATGDNLRRLAEGEGVDSGRLPTELNGAIDCFPKVNEKLFPMP